MHCDLCAEEIIGEDMYIISKYKDSLTYPILNIHTECYQQGISIVRSIFECRKMLTQPIEPQKDKINEVI